jgi:hypothetical protein
VTTLAPAGVSEPERPTTTPRTTRPAPGSRSDQRLAWGFVAVTATAGVQWFGLLGASSLSLKWFHLAALALVALVALTPDLATRLEIIAHRWGLFWVAVMVYLAAVLSTHVLRAEPFLPLALFARQAVYAGAGILFAVTALSLVTDKARRPLAWASLITAVVALTALFEPLVRRGINPFSLLADGFLGGNPEVVIFGLFRASFASAGGLADEAVRANLRHGLASALALSIFLTVLVRADLSRWSRRVADVGIAASGLVLAITLSRSIILAVLAWLAIVTARPLFRGRASLRRWALPGFLAASVAVLSLSPLGDVFEERFLSNEGSVEAREASLTDAIAHVDEYLLGANDVDIEASPHNVVFDALMAGGLVGLLAAVVFFGVLVAALVRLVLQYLTDDGSWRLPVSQAAVIGIGLIPFVRFLTAGGGMLSFGEWAAAGAFFAFLALNARATRAAVHASG